MRKPLAGALIALTLAGCAPVTEPPPPTDAELAQYVAEQQAMQWYFLAPVEYEQPAAFTELVRADDFVRRATDCSTLSQQQDESLRHYLDESFTCQVALMLYPTEVAYYTPAQLDFIYGYFKDSLVPCLQLQGLDVGYAPSRDEFTGQAGIIPWDPYSELGAALPPSRADEITQRCPPMPTASFIGPR